MFDRFWHKFLRRPYTLYVARDTRTGKRALRTVVFIHGISADSSTWNPVTDKLEYKKNLRIVAMDLLGYGRSASPNWLSYSAEDQIRAIHHTLKKRGISKYILVGHSMGALIAAELTQQYSRRVQKLILVAPPFLSNEDNRKLTEKLQVSAFERIKKSSSSRLMDPIAKMAEKFSSFRAGSFDTPAFRRSMDNIILSDRPMTIARELTTPTTILAGWHDALILLANIKKLASDNPNVKVVEVSSGHTIREPMARAIVAEIESMVK